MAIFKGLVKRKEDSITEIVFLIYDYIAEFQFHSAKIVNEKSETVENFGSSEQLNFINAFKKFTDENYLELEWIGEVKFDDETKSLFNKLKNNK